MPLVLAWAGWASQPQENEGPPHLEVVSRFRLTGPADKPGVTDLRWAGKDSVYLADYSGAVSEVRLAEGLPVLQRVAPAAAELGLGVRSVRRLAISDRWIVTANLGQLAWKSIRTADPRGGWQMAKKRGYFHDFDIEGDEVVMLGWPPGDGYDGLDRGGIVWRANLADGLDRWEPLYESKEVAGNLELVRTAFALGSIRFLRRGGWIVAPSFVPGALQLSPSGSVKTQWGAQELWSEQKPWIEGHQDPAKLARFLATTPTVDVVLALPEGPALVVREPKGTGARYRLAILGPEIRWYDIPLHGVSSVAQVRGDADEKGNIVLAGVLRIGLRAALVPESEIVVFRLPT